MKAFSSNIYQIYPLGAAGAPFENDHVLTHRLGRFEEWTDHLKKLNMDMVLFNPLFESVSHGYDTIDFRKVDARLGDNEDLKHLMNHYHENGISVLFDAVFNHVGREFGPFQDVLKNRENSRYKDWFIIDFGGNNSYNDGLWYQNWEGHDALVKLNLRNSEVVSELLSVVDFWIDEFGVDGLRLDVAYCLDQDFLRTLHNHVKSRNLEFFLLGETLHGDYNTWVNDQMLDSCTNYECYKGLYSSFNSKNFYEILYSFNRQFGKEPWCLYTGKHLLSFVDNHDVNRIASQLDDKNLLPALYAILYTMPGIPAVYYGSEWGMEGRKNANDTELRKEVRTPEWNDLTETISKLARIHKEHPELIYGDYTQIAINNPWAIYQRSLDGKSVWTAINLTDQPVNIPVNAHQSMTDLMTGESVEINGSVPVEKESFRLLAF
ncbi:alpha-amylase family glycosyl hydrolase [Allobaculum mucilyticum]|uniref:alpha-amylase family glycosyl hydrolase n=1 Tax=Allobaculum mucilyticum TaxID=2834459 RepID=UPI001E2BF320|nr:alpha-amylase family glycosyl hydrolase [Allobaculum mucilyticum]UNT96222.1 cyclomaltodextrinase [Allobaculum mucilyticum]